MLKLISLFLTNTLSFIFRGIAAKFFIFSTLFYITTEFIPVIINMFLPKSIDLSYLFEQLPSSVWYFINLFQFPFGIPLLLSAMLTRFIIRRIPIIG